MGISSWLFWGEIWGRGSCEMAPGGVFGWGEGVVGAMGSSRHVSATCPEMALQELVPSSAVRQGNEH